MPLVARCRVVVCALAFWLSGCDRQGDAGIEAEPSSAVEAVMSAPAATAPPTGEDDDGTEPHTSRVEAHRADLARRVDAYVAQPTHTHLLELFDVATMADVRALVVHESRQVREEMAEKLLEDGAENGALAPLFFDSTPWTIYYGCGTPEETTFRELMLRLACHYEAGRPAVVRVAHDTHQDRAFRAKAAACLKDRAATPPSVPKMRRSLRSTSRWDRKEAIAYLASLRDEASRGAIRAALEGEDDDVRQAAALGLTWWGDRSAVPELFTMLDDGGQPAADAARALVALRAVDAIPKLEAIAREGGYAHPEVLDAIERLRKRASTGATSRATK